jgi:hypothetical protein
VRVSVGALVAAAVLALPGVADADHGAPVLDDALSTYLTVAWSHWGGPRPSCTVNDTVIDVHAVFFDDPDPTVVARADQPGCRIWLDAGAWGDFDAVGMCAVVVHEWGHLLGHGHADDPRDVMAEEPDHPPAGCARLARSARRPGAAHPRARCRRRGKHPGRSRRSARKACRQARAHRRLP